MSQVNRGEEGHGRHVWQSYINAWKESGLSGAECCRRRQISYHAFTSWKKRLVNTGESVELVPVPLVFARPPGKSSTLIVGAQGIPLTEFFGMPAQAWFQ